MFYISSTDRVCIDIFRKYIYNYLKDNKLKYSDQRERVLKILHSQNYPVSINFLVKKLNEETEGAGYATVSRHIKFFQKIDLLISINKTKNTYLLKKNLDDIKFESNHQTISIEDAKEIIKENNFGVCYEPVINLSDMSIYAYEALSRFKYKDSALAPDVFFKAIHDEIDFFFSHEMIIKSFQLKHRPVGIKLFLNFDSDICVEDAKVKLWLELFKDEEEVIVDIVENSSKEQIANIEYFMKWLKENDIPSAYNDYGTPNSVFSPKLFHKSNYLKFDIFFINTIKLNPSYANILQAIVTYAKEQGQYTILEGVETKKDLEIAKEIGVNYVQGFLFKEKFISVWNDV